MLQKLQEFNECIREAIEIIISIRGYTEVRIFDIFDIKYMSKKDIFTKKNITSDGKNAIFYGDISKKYDCFAQEIINRIDNESYKKAAKYLEWVIKRDNHDKYAVIQIADVEDLERQLGVDWSKIISEIAKDLSIENAFELDSIFRNIFTENYEMARGILDDFIKEYEE